MALHLMGARPATEPPEGGTECGGSQEVNVWKRRILEDWVQSPGFRKQLFFQNCISEPHSMLFSIVVTS